MKCEEANHYFETLFITTALGRQFFFLELPLYQVINNCESLFIEKPSKIQINDFKKTRHDKKPSL